MPRLKDEPLSTPVITPSARPMSENKTGDWRSVAPRVDREKCTGCAICWKFCPEACVDISGEVPRIDMHYCKGCGICATECPSHCIHMSEQIAEEAAS